MITSSIQHLINVLFKRFNHSPTRLGFHLSTLSLTDQIQHLHFGLVDSCFNLTHGSNIGNRIRNTKLDCRFNGSIEFDNLDLNALLLEVVADQGWVCGSKPFALQVI